MIVRTLIVFLSPLKDSNDSGLKFIIIKQFNGFSRDIKSIDLFKLFEKVML
jgi:hypothetical protein